MLKFNVFGKLIGVESTGVGWTPFFIGAEGKRRRAEFEIPDALAEEELPRYLADLFHESACAAHPDVFRIP